MKKVITAGLILFAGALLFCQEAEVEAAEDSTEQTVQEEAAASVEIEVTAETEKPADLEEENAVGEVVTEQTDENVVEEKPARKIAKQNSNSHIDSDFTFDLPLRAGGYLNFAPAVGDTADLVFGSIGGGLTGELGAKADLPVEIGLDLNLIFNGNPVVTDKLVSMWNIQTLAGCYVRVKLPEGFIVQPAINLGLAYNFQKRNSVYYNKVDNCAVEALYQVQVGVRYSNPKILNSKLEFNLTPVITMCPEYKKPVSYVGFTAGALWKFF